MKWKDASDSELDTELAAIRFEHDPTAAKNLIEYFHHRFTTGQSYNERILRDYVAYAFSKIVEENWTADHAFGLKLRRGQYPRESTDERALSAAIYMILLMRQGKTWLDAKNDAANFFFPDGKGEKVVEKTYSYLKEEFSKDESSKDEFPGFTDEFLMEMIPDDAPLISRDMKG